MSVVPLVATGEGATVVTTREQGRGENTLLVLGMDLAQLADDSSNASYDLRVGKEYREHQDNRTHFLGEDDDIKLGPGMATVIETEEYVQLPRGLFALVVPKVGLLQRGVSNTLSKIDPGYDGHLLVTVFNLGRETVRLRRLDRFCSLCLLRVERGARLYSKPGQSIRGHAKKSRWRQRVDYVARNPPILQFGHLVATVGLLIVAVTSAC